MFTCFPARRDKPVPIGGDRTDVLENIKKDRTRVASCDDLAGRVIHKCLTSCLDPVTNRNKDLQFLEFYDTEIGRLVRDSRGIVCRIIRSELTNRQADEEAERFEEFSNAVTAKEKAREDKLEGKVSPLKSEDKKKYKAFSITMEIGLLEEIKDIQDELHVLELVLKDQQNVVDDFCNLLKTDQKGYASKSQRAVKRYKDQVDRMIDRAKHTQAAVGTLALI